MIRYDQAAATKEERRNQKDSIEKSEEHVLKTVFYCQFGIAFNANICVSFCDLSPTYPRNVVNIRQNAD